MTLCDYLVKRYNMHPNDKLLDVGQGKGDHVLGFWLNGLRAMGIDKDQCDLNRDKLPFGDKSFDYIFCKSVLEHLDSYGVIYKLVKEMFRILKPNGMIIIMIPSLTKFWYEHPEHITQIEPSDFFGFPLEAELFYQLPFVWRYPFLKFIPELIARFIPDRFRFHKDGTQNVLVRHSKEPMWLISTNRVMASSRLAPQPPV